MSQTREERMEQYYGKDWNKFREPHFCPKCSFDLRDHENGPPGKLEIAYIENDRCVEVNCPNCRKTL